MGQRMVLGRGGSERIQCSRGGLLVDWKNLGRVLVVKVGDEKKKHILLTLSAGLL